MRASFSSRFSAFDPTLDIFLANVLPSTWIARQTPAADRQHLEGRH